MKRFLIAVFALVCLLTPSLGHAQVSNPKINIAPMNGFETYLSAAFTKKNVPAQALQTADGADYILRSTPVNEKEESGASKFARCMFAYCAGIEGTNTVSVQLIDTKTNVSVWAYSVKKQGAKNYQSSAEACAKHLKNWLEHKGN